MAHLILRKFYVQNSDIHQNSDGPCLQFNCFIFQMNKLKFRKFNPPAQDSKWGETRTEFSWWYISTPFFIAGCHLYKEWDGAIKWCIHQIFTEHLLCIRHCDVMVSKNSHSLCPPESYTLVGFRVIYQTVAQICKYILC